MVGINVMRLMTEWLCHSHSRWTVWSVLFGGKRLCSKEEDDMGESYNWYMITCCPCRQPASSLSGRSKQLELFVKSCEPVCVMKHWTMCACCVLSFRTELRQRTDCEVKWHSNMQFLHYNKPISTNIVCVFNRGVNLSPDLGVSNCFPFIPLILPCHFPTYH